MRLRAAITCGLVCIGAVAHAEPRSVTVVPHPLEFDPRPELLAAQDKLRAAWFEAMREAGSVVTPSRREVDAALQELPRRDCKTSDDCLAALAVKGAGLYAAHTALALTEGGVFVATARVVRDDGKLMASFTMEQARGDKKAPLVPVVKRLLVEVVKGLGVERLPAFKEAIAAPPPAPVLVATPPTPPPPPPAVTEPVPAPRTDGRRTVGFVVMSTGFASAVAGGVMLLVTYGQSRALSSMPGLLNDGSAESVARAKALNTQHYVGLGLAGGGFAVALAGLVLAVTGGESPVVIAPIEGGALAAFEGRWP